MLGAIMGAMVVIIRPYISIKQLVRDALIVFVFTVLSGLLLEQWADFMNESVRTGIAGVCGFFAVRIYEIAVAILTKLKNDPDKVIDAIKK
jgi:hypothetical protein